MFSAIITIYFLIKLLSSISNIQKLCQEHKTDNFSAKVRKFDKRGGINKRLLIKIPQKKLYFFGVSKRIE